MILNDKQIFDEYIKGNIQCSPFEIDNIQPASLDLRLNNIIKIDQSSSNVSLEKVSKAGNIRVVSGFNYKEIDLNITDFYIKPGEFLLGSTLECVGSSSGDIVAQLADKSTLARLGLSVFFSAGWIDPGNILNITLELKNNSNRSIQLISGMHICQLVFYKLNEKCDKIYKGKYLNSAGVEHAQ